MSFFSRKVSPPNDQIRSKVINLITNLMADYFLLQSEMEKLMEYEDHNTLPPS